QSITIVPGTNHCSDVWVPRPETLESSGANNARKNNGWKRPNITEKGSLMTGFSSRVKTMDVSVTSLLLMRRPPDGRRCAGAVRGRGRLRWAEPGLHAGCVQ